MMQAAATAADWAQAQVASMSKRGMDAKVTAQAVDHVHQPYAQLEQEWRRLHAFHGALALLRWDAAVMMPRGSADVRGEQLAALETEHHALLTTPRITRLLDRAQANAQGSRTGSSRICARCGGSAIMPSRPPSR